MVTIDKLKEVFCGPKSLLFSKALVDLAQSNLALTVDMELPVEVDSLKATMEDPTINHYKVIGLSGDWATTAELGDFNVEFVVPSKAKDLLEAMFGEDAVKDLIATLSGTGDSQLDTQYTGVAVETKLYKMRGTIVIVDEEKKNLMVVTNLSLYATMQWDDTGTKPVAFKFSGSVEGAGKKSVAWLTKGDGVMKLTFNKDKATTRKSVPAAQRRQGLVITYTDTTSTSTVVKEKYMDTRTDDTEWVKDDNWVSVK